MASAETPLSGPDLRAGVDAGSLLPGQRILGHADGEAVLLSRVGDEYLAIGATCTHYGGPLAEGVIDGETVRCPWHHACFSLRNGEALRAPALSPVACWKVEERGGRIVVTGKVASDPLAPSYPARIDDAALEKRIVIIGAGAAGAAAAEMLRRCGHTGSVIAIDDDPDSPYDRPNLSKDYLAGNAPEEWIPLRPSDFYSSHDIRLLRGRATRVDPKSMRVEVDGPEATTLEFDALLLAPGAEPVHLSLPGMELPHVHYLRSLADSRAIIAAAASAKRAVVIGSSFIGLEVAASLRARGLSVDVIGRESLPLERVLGPELGAFIKSLHEDKGVTFHLEHEPRSIEQGAVVLDDGRRIDADIVVVGVGVKPRLGLAEEAGLKIDRGVVVDEYLESSASGIFAAGDIARWPDARSGMPIRVEHWVLAQRQGQTAARNMLGARERFDQAPFFWSAHYDATINYVGHAEKWDRIDVDGDPAKRDVAVRYIHDGRTLAVATVFRDEESLNAELDMERGDIQSPHPVT